MNDDTAQTQRLHAADELNTLACYAGCMPVNTLLSRALESTRVFVPAELVGPIECILDATLVREVRS